MGIISWVQCTLREGFCLGWLNTDAFLENLFLEIKFLTTGLPLRKFFEKHLQFFLLNFKTL